MRKMKKAGLLLILLAVPALLFLFLKGTAKHYYSVPRYFPLIDSTNGKIRTTYRLMGDEKVLDTLFHTIPDFKLIDQSGRKITRNHLNGKVFVSDFFFTRCPGICKKMMFQMTRVQDRFKNKEDFKIVSYSVDQEYDGVEQLSEYADRNNVKADMWYLLGGDKEQIYKLAKYGYYVTAKEDKPYDNNIENRFVHTEKFILADRYGQIRGYYNGTDRKDVDRLMTEIDILLRENQTDKRIKGTPKTN